MIIGKMQIRLKKFKLRNILFIPSGIFAVFTDYITFILLIHLFTPSIAKAISFFIGVLVSWFFNSNFTFILLGNKFFTFFKYLLVVFFSLFINVISFKYFDILIQESNHNISFLIATILSAFTNFILMKNLVFDE